MKKPSLLFIVGFVLFSFTFALLMQIFIPNSKAESSYTSPLPDFLTLSKNKQVRILDLWEPLLEAVSGSGKSPDDFTSKSILMYDLKTNKTLFEKDSKKRLPMASLTKIMTAIIALENKNPNDKYVVRGSDLVGEDSMGLESGEVLTSEELMYGLFLNSGNDAAEVLANNFLEGRVAFIKAMNDKALSMGLKDTVFSNPSGLQGDGVQYTTAYDLLVITRYALNNFPLIKQVASTYEYIIHANSTHKEFHLFNETNLLTTYPGVKGMKTGFTPEAGMCLVTYLDYEDQKIVGILLNSENRRQEMKDLLDFSLNSLGIPPPEHD